METTPALDTALSAERVRWFLCGKAELPGHTALVLEAPGEVTFNGDTYKGEDSVLGSFDSIENIGDGIGDQAPTILINLNPPSDVEASQLVDPDMQGSRMRIYLGALAMDGTPIPDPLLVFDGEVDMPRLNIGMNERKVELECVSSFEKFFMNDEGLRLSPTSHKEFWPDETGLDAITGVVRNLIWGPGEKIRGPTNRPNDAYELLPFEAGS